jgi:acetyltransferase-like isoleucine patch superfamily enzyme
MVDRELTPPPPSAFAAFGAGSMIVPPARVESPRSIWIGSNVRIHENGWLCVKPQPSLPAPRLTIGDGTSINRFAKIVCAGEVSIGDGCMLAEHVFISDTRYRYEDPNRPIIDQGLELPRPVIIGRNTFIGFRAIVAPGVNIGENAYVGAGAVVTEDVPDRCVVVGDPARIVRRYDAVAGTWGPA